MFKFQQALKPTGYKVLWCAIESKKYNVQHACIDTVTEIGKDK